MSSKILHTDQELYTRVAAGDERAFRELFDLYVPRLQAVIYRVTKSATVTDDLVQEVFLKIWVARDRLAEIGKPAAWIIRIGFLLALNHVRRLAIHGKVMQQVGYSSNQQAPGCPSGETVEFRQMIGLIADAVERLPSKQQQVYRLSREQGLTIAEIAEQMNLAVSTVKNLLVMALKHIRHYLENAGYPLPLLLFLLFS